MATGALGFVGAWAFNPDDGAVAHSEALWRVFGIAAYAALPTVVMLVLVSTLWAWAAGRGRGPR